MTAPARSAERPARIQPRADYRVTFDGHDLSPLIAPRLISLTLTESRAEEADTLDLVLDDSDNRLAIPKRGAQVKVALGWAGQSLVDKGAFTVDEVEHSGAPDVITLRARSASMTEAMHERRECSWHRQTLGAIARTVAARHALKPAIAEALERVLIDHIDQTHESDMAFLTRLAKRYDAVMNVKDLRLLLMPIGTGKTASGKPLDTLTITRASGDQHRYHVAQRESYAAVRAHWHSNAGGRRHSVLAGAQDRKNVKVLPDDYASEAEARAAAEAEFARTQRSQATMTICLALGRAEVFPEMPVTVSGFKPEIDQAQWLVKTVTHTLSEAGFVTKVDLEIGNDPATPRHRSKFKGR